MQHVDPSTIIPSTSSVPRSVVSPNWILLGLDYIETVAQFLPLLSIVSILRCCHDWHRVTSKIRTHSHSLQMNGENLAQVINWSHKKWINSLDCTKEHLNHKRVESIRDHLQLVSLSCFISIEPDTIRTPLSFGSLLSLRVKLYVQGIGLTDESAETRAHQWSGVELLIESACSQCHSLESLTIGLVTSQLRLSPIPVSAFESLLKIKSTLTHLSIGSVTSEQSWRGPFASEHINILRQLTQLTSIHLRRGYWRETELAKFVAEPSLVHITRIREFHLKSNNITTSIGESLSKFIDLRTLSPASWMITDITFLTHLLQLRTLHLYHVSRIGVSNLVESVSKCILLESLALGPFVH